MRGLPHSPEKGGTARFGHFLQKTTESAVNQDLFMSLIQLAGEGASPSAKCWKGWCVSGLRAVNQTSGPCRRT
jgi:hypothetical protein